MSLAFYRKLCYFWKQHGLLIKKKNTPHRVGSLIVNFLNVTIDKSYIFNWNLSNHYFYHRTICIYSSWYFWRDGRQMHRHLIRSLHVKRVETNAHSPSRFINAKNQPYKNIDFRFACNATLGIANHIIWNKEETILSIIFVTLLKLCNLCSTA